MELIQSACQTGIAGRLAERALSAWVRDRGVTEAEFRVLWSLYHGEAAGAASDSHSVATADQSEFAAQLAVSTAQISAVVERLADRRLIASQIDPADRRRRLWRLSEEGRSIVVRIIAGVQASADGRLHSLGFGLRSA